MQWLFNWKNQIAWFIYISSLFVLLTDIFAIGICSVVFVVLYIIEVQYNCIYTCTNCCIFIFINKYIEMLKLVFVHLLEMSGKSTLRLFCRIEWENYTWQI